MKYALVTGCDHGVGLALAAQLAERGYTVAACRINPEERLIEDKGTVLLSWQRQKNRPLVFRYQIMKGNDSMTASAWKRFCLILAVMALLCGAGLV